MGEVKSEQLDTIVQIMNKFQYPWFIAGGWAIDLGVGKVTRKYEDVDICIFREYTQEILDYFSDWKISVTIPGERRLEPVTSVEDTRLPRFGLHLHKENQFIEILLTDVSDDKVLFRRDPSISMDIDKFVRVDKAGRKYVAPEWQLLFKAKEGRVKDEHDFRAYLPTMTVEQREWLLSALRKHVPNSSWINDLQF
ncbi:MAG TPA: hypothetical protein VEY68_05265 [Anoxybacillus sp.]|nr:hypothetical protein [Anoxybacillus sp.]